MEKLTFAQIEEIINSDLFDEFDHAPIHFMWEDVYGDYTDIENEDNDESTTEFIEAYKLLGNFEMVEHYGGEGDGDKYYTVYHFIDHEIYIKFYGWYVSYSGSEYSGMYEVQPEQETITVYNQKK